MNRRSSRAGFSLLESTVAVVILALVLPVLIKTIESGILGMSSAESLALRWRLANDLMTEAAATTDGRRGRRDGQDGDLVWTIEIARYDAKASEPRDDDDRSGLTQLHVTVRSRSGGRRADVVTLDTLVLLSGRK